LILKKSFREFKFLKKTLDIFNYIVKFCGYIFLLSLAIVILFYYSSNISKTYNLNSLFFKINDKIINRYLGLDFRKSSDYFSIIKFNLFNYFRINELENLYLILDQETIIGLESQREIKREFNGPIPDELKKWFPASLKLNSEKIKAKIELKGNRPIHWQNPRETSYKIDIKGENRIWKMEEFSLQKPITKNYTYEFIFHRLFDYIDLINIEYFFINLFFNDQNYGVYAVEESFSKEVIERNNKRNGPIFSLKDEKGEYFPEVSYELYSKEFWIKSNPLLVKNLFSVLNNLGDDIININSYFDMDKWARYFAAIDLTGAYHGSLLKSVKLYYNPVTALFEPIGYDLHLGAGTFDDFIFSDFISKERPNVLCNFICDHEQWYMLFFKKKNGELNNEFLKKYLFYLKEYSSEKFISEFLYQNQDNIKKINNAIYKEYSKTDKISWIGLGLFVYDESYLFKRASLIKSRIDSINLNTLDISRIENRIYFKDYKFSNFPVLARTDNCDSKNEIKELYFAGNMETKLSSSCKKIVFFDNKGNDKILDLDENLRLSNKIFLDLKNNFLKVQDYKNLKRISHNEFKLEDKELLIEKNTFIHEEQKIFISNNSIINIINGATLFIEGEIIYENKDNNLNLIFSSDFTGSLLFNNNKFNLKNIIFKNLNKPNLENYILYGGVNFINSNINLENIFIENSMNEDGINIINSKAKIKDIYFNDIFADAFDLDFSDLEFENITCNNTSNDCLDVSGSEVFGRSLISKNSGDKGLSVGENSNIKIKNIELYNNNVGIAVKDGSVAILDNIKVRSNIFDIAIFNKKKEYSNPKLKANMINEVDKNKILQSKNSDLVINSVNYKSKLTNKYINQIIY